MALVLLATVPAGAQEAEEEPEDATAEKKEGSALGLSPGIPQVSALPGGFTPAYSGAEDAEQWHADFHGFLRMPLNVGVNKRSGPVTDDQYETVLHVPPMVPEYRDSFRYTSAIPDPYVQLHFGYGNSNVQANVIVQTRSAATAASFFDSSTRGGITDAFLTFHGPSLGDDVDMMIHVGAFTSRYGIMGEYDEGRYGTPLFARTNGIGENVVAFFELGELTLELQQGLQGLSDTAPLGIVPGDWNDYADPNLGTSLVHHYHAGLGYQGLATLGAHYMTAFSADDRANQGLNPDGAITLMGADLRLTMHRYGHLFVGATMTTADNARSVGRVIEVLNAAGGPGLMRNFLGPNSGGDGQMLTWGGQYDLSLARAIYGNLFEGKSPDIVLSLFGMFNQVQSDDDAYDDKAMMKFGGEAGYSLLPWLATSVRVDHVAPDLDDNDESYTVVSPRVIFRTDWQARDQVVLQYSNYSYGDEVYVRTGSPALIDPNVNPDEHVVSLSASMWW